MTPNSFRVARAILVIIAMANLIAVQWMVLRSIDNLAVRGILGLVIAFVIVIMSDSLPAKER